METNRVMGIVLITIIISATVGYYLRGIMQPKEMEEEEVYPVGSLEAILKAGKISVVTSIDYPPWVSYDEQGNTVGFDVDLLDLVAEEMGVEVEWTDMDWDLAVSSIMEQKADMCVGGMSITPPRMEAVEYSMPLYVEQYFLVTWNGSGVVMNKWEDLGKYILGIEAGGGAGRQDIQETLVEPGYMSEENIKGYPKVSQVIWDLLDKRVDLAYISETVYLHEEEEYKGKLEVVWARRQPNEYGLGWALNKDQHALKGKIDSILFMLKRTGVINELKEKWGIPLGAE